MDGPILLSFMASRESLKDIFKRQTLKEPKLAQMYKVLRKWFTAIYSRERPVTGRVVIEKVKSFYDEVKVTDKCTFSEGSNKKLPVRTSVSRGGV
jgi:hypothetical protein